MATLPPPPKFVSKLVGIAPLLLAVSAIITSIAQWKPASVDKKISEDIQNVQRQVQNLTETQLELQKSLAALQIQQSEEMSTRKVVAQLEYSSAVIEARTIRQRFGAEVAEKYLLNKQKIRDEIVKVETVK